jgi:hypothetical protein
LTFARDLVSFPPIPRGAPNGAEMAVSRTLEPDPGHTGVGTENASQGASFYSPLHLDLHDCCREIDRCRLQILT